MIVKIKDIEKKENTDVLIGKKISWKSPAGKIITGKISNVHGNSGCVRVIFEKGMPGQAIASKVLVE